MTRIFVGLGGNRGRPQQQLQRAVRLLRKLPGSRLTARSPIYLSAPVGCPGRQPPYYNAVVKMHAALPPLRMWRQLRQVEKKVQRAKRARNAPRRIDIDYILHGPARMNHPHLTLPHPRYRRRAFVLRPMLDLTPPRAKQDAAALRRALAACAGQQLRRI